MELILGAAIALLSAALGFFAGRTVVGAAPELRLPGKVHGYYPTDEELGDAPADE